MYKHLEGDSNGVRTDLEGALNRGSVRHDPQSAAGIDMGRAERAAQETAPGKRAAATAKPPQPMKTPTTSGATVGIIGAANAFPTMAPVWPDHPEAEWPPKNGDGSRQKGSRPIRLCGSGALVGFAHLDEPQRSEIRPADDEREPVALFDPHGEVRGLSVVTDEGISASGGSDAPGRVAQDDHVGPPYSFNR